MRTQLICGVALCVGFWARPGWAEGLFDDPQVAPEVRLTECPAAVQKTLKVEAGGRDVGKIRKRDDPDHHRTVYWVTVEEDGKPYGIEVNKDGTLLSKSPAVEDRRERTFAECPAAVRKTLAHEAAGVAMPTVMEQRLETRLVYSVRVTVDGTDYVIAVSENGTLLEKSVPPLADNRLAQGDQYGGDIKLSACPEAVQKTLQKETGDGTVTAVRYYMENPTAGEWAETHQSAHYIATLRIKGKAYRMTVAGDGSVVRKLQPEEAEKPGEANP